MNITFTFIAGVMTGLVIAAILVLLWRGASTVRHGSAWRYAVLLAVGVTCTACALLLYELRGSPPVPSRPDEPAVEAAATQSSHADAIAANLRQVAQDPGDAGSWLQLANLYRQQRQYGPAGEAFARLVKLKAMTADSWADYADVQASLTGSLAGEPATFIEKSLALDAGHPKALWLKASLAHEQGDNVQALALWSRLRAVLPADSPDAALVDTNMAEARRLAGAPDVAAGTNPDPPLDSTMQPVAITGTVALDPKFATRVAPGTPVFIFARALGEQGPPVAVQRTVTGGWPLQFRLDDTMAMMPTRKLSGFRQVTVEARISRSGQATPASGDLFTVSTVLSPRDGKPLALTISSERN